MFSSKVISKSLIDTDDTKAKNIFLPTYLPYFFQTVTGNKQFFSRPYQGAPQRPGMNGLEWNNMSNNVMWHSPD